MIHLEAKDSADYYKVFFNHKLTLCPSNPGRRMVNGRAVPTWAGRRFTLPAKTKSCFTGDILKQAVSERPQSE